MEEINRQLIERARQIQGVFLLSGGQYDAGRVGAALRTRDGNIYTGICMDMACGVGFCAEHAAVIEMLKHRETLISAIVAVGGNGIMPPCGRCRELLMQVDPRNAACKVILGEEEIVELGKLLPCYWNEGK